jgi:hypothetical protein
MRTLDDTEYNQLTGKLYEGLKEIGTVARTGYVVVRANGMLHLGHRLAWFHKTGAWPAGSVDHIDGNRANNKWANLRVVTAEGNARNRVLTKTRTLKNLPGAHFHKPTGRFKSAIMVSGKQIHLGYFPNAASASAAYVSAKATMHQQELRHA